MVLEVEEAIEVYREYASYPSVTKGRICNAQAPGHVRVYSVWSQRDLERGETVKFGRGHIVQLDVVFPTPASNVGTEQWNVESPSGRLRAVVRKVTNKKGEDKQFIEIWSDSRMVHNLDVESLDQHGKIYEDTQFGCLEWSHSETHLLYIAEKKRPTPKSFFDKKAAKDVEEGKKDIARGTEYVYSEDWGEQMTGKCHPALCVLDIDAGAVSVLENVPDDVSPGQAVWCPDDLGIVCVGWWHVPYRLGVVYCPIRRSALFYIDLKTFSCTILGDSDQSVRSPRFSPDQKKLFYLENPVGGPHFRCAKLMMIDWSTKGVVPVVDIVRKAKGSDFPGLFLTSLPRRCMAGDSRRIILSVQWRSKLELACIDCEMGTVQRLTNDPSIGCWQFLDINHDLVLAACSSPNTPQHLVIGHLPEVGKETEITWTPLDTNPVSLPQITWKVLTMEVPKDRVNPQYEDLDYECILLEPSQMDSKKPPLVVHPHGGPHSVFSADFGLYTAGFVRCGYSVLMINYRGSYGFGQDSIDSLPGHIGTQDVRDCQGAVEAVLEMGVADPDRVVVTGGSHGGFLTGHLIGQYPDFYKAAVSRNPVLSLPSMYGSSDIPDWLYTEIGAEFEFSSTPDGPTYTKMYEMSPIRHVDKMKTPLMIMIGAKDQRVPPKQGQELRKALQARGVEVKTLLYPECEHPITEVKSEADSFINIIDWFAKHMPK